MVLPKMRVADMTGASSLELYEIHDSYYSQVKAFIQSTVRDEWAAEDLTQETFLRAHRKLNTLEDRARIKPWLYRIAHNICLDHFRMAGRRSAQVISIDDLAVMADAPGSDNVLERQQMSSCVQNLILQVPESLRPVLWLYDVDGFSQKEIADILEISVDNVKVRLFRARKKMKTLFNENCNFERDNRNILVCEPKNGFKP